MTKTMRELQTQLKIYESKQRLFKSKADEIKKQLMLFTSTCFPFELEMISTLPRDVKNIILYFVYLRMLLRERYSEAIAIGYFPTFEIKKLLRDCYQVQKVVKHNKHPMHYHIMTFDSKIYRISVECELEFLDMLFKDSSISMDAKKFTIKKISKKQPTHVKCIIKEFLLKRYTRYLKD